MGVFFFYIYDEQK